MAPSVCFNFFTKAYGKCRVYRFRFDEMGRVLKHFSEICFFVQFQFTISMFFELVINLPITG